MFSSSSLMLFVDLDRIQYLGNSPSPDVPIFTIIFLSTIAHSFIFYFLPSSLAPLIKSYVVSTFHAIVCILSVVNFFSCYSVNLKQINRIAGGGIYGTGDEVMTYSICYSFGYFTYDLLLMLFYKSVRTKSALIHHIIILVGLFSGIMNGICHSCHFYLLGEELSTIPLNLKAIYQNRPRLHKVFTYLFVISFVFSRIIYGSIICGYAFRAAPQFIQMASNVGDLKSIIIGLSQAALCILTRILNFYWLNLILQKLFHLQKSKKKIL
ncbi:unnamed protein product [Rotaria sp. Silwood2]|nr:unnamed protein product [Rotaria sp. Silwood2]CAF3187171.1 unnamed protein product [Rotaria sp. Silwood2]CAF3298798.1 unnamed protein product [Rotaria sp. Silwood2]CAF4133977.1 unnamed protein product [Rotaria sp. Silwood2]CAF4224404.1 unnamed protein product [Rotaria sp. Silwood2]